MNVLVTSLILTLGLSLGTGVFAAEKKERNDRSTPQELKQYPGKAERQSRRGTRGSGERREEARAGQERHGVAPRVNPAVMRLFSVLTPEQRASLREVMREHREKAGAAEQKIANARRQLMESSLREKIDEQAIRRQAQALAQLETERVIRMAKALSQVKPPLSKEQRARLSRVMGSQPGRGRFGPPQGGFGPGQNQRPPAFRDGERFPGPGMFGPGPGGPMFQERFRGNWRGQQPPAFRNENQRDQFGNFGSGPARPMFRERFPQDWSR